jgi:hypothetical protein
MIAAGTTAVRKAARVRASTHDEEQPIAELPPVLAVTTTPAVGLVGWERRSRRAGRLRACQSSGAAQQAEDFSNTSSYTPPARDRLYRADL